MYGEVEARAVGELVYRSEDRRAAWCLCPACTERHASGNKRRTKHDRWALFDQDWRIREDLARAPGAWPSAGEQR